MLLPVGARLRDGAVLRPQLMEEASRENLPSQKLGVDDLIAVSVYDAPELTRTVRVEPDGAIHLPMLTEGVPQPQAYLRTMLKRPWSRRSRASKFSWTR